MRRTLIALWASGMFVILLIATGFSDRTQEAATKGTQTTAAAGETSPTTTTPNASQRPAAGEQIKWQVIAGGGANNGSSANYRLSGTAGQTAVGGGSSANYGLGQGFWQPFSTGQQYVCGDADGNGIITISDAVYLISYIFGGGPAPVPVLAGDADCNGIITISDAVYLINYIFGGGPAPCANCP